MIEEEHWHPVAQAQDVAGQPLAVTLLERAVVLWRDAAGIVHAWADQCPHRGAKLSLGRVVAGQLECAYHGWQFEGAGRCVHVPALPGFSPPASHCAVTFAACEKYGLVWVRMAQDKQNDPAEPPVATQDLPEFAAETDPALRKLNCGPYDVATSATRIVENFLDMAHFGFVHEGLLGMRSNTAIDNYQVTATPNGLLATQCRAWQPQSNVNSTAPAQVEYTYEVTGPFTAVLTKVPDAASVSLAAGTGTGAGESECEGDGAGAYRESIALFICPITPETSRVWFRLAVADFGSTDEKLREFQHTIFMQDKPVLESQSPKRLPLLAAADRRAEVHTAADKTSAAYRRHLLKLGLHFGVC
jgi:phenylpropionate dioxygenase-like ring-hydroxylating dioxygenase large terminal subunit